MNMITSHLRVVVATVVFALLLCASANTRQRGVGLDTSNTEKRAALVIGNGTYEAAPLKNPVNDARDIAQALSQLGFEVIHKEDLNQNDLKRAIREFGAKIRNGGVGLFYYAGHGIQVKGVNYLIPVGANIESEEEVEYEGVDVGFVLAQMESAGNRTNIVILDACRNNPFARSFRSASRGLASIDAPSGTLLAYATAPGSVASDGEASNGLYTQELLKNMRTPGLSVEDIFKRVRISVLSITKGKQIPWESSSLTGNFYFTATDPVVLSPNVQTTVPSVDSAAFELSYWDSVKNSKSVEDFRAYLKRYPGGIFVELAASRIKSLESPANVSTPTEVGEPVRKAAGDRQQAKVFKVNHRHDGGGSAAGNLYISRGKLEFEETESDGGTPDHNLSASCSEIEGTSKRGTGSITFKIRGERFPIWLYVEEPGIILETFQDACKRQ